MRETPVRTAVILAGGQGTRLRPYTSEIPKPLVPVGDYPIIEILLRRLKESGVTDVRIAVNHLAHLITSALGDGGRFGLNVSYWPEEKPLSTIGPLALIENLPEEFLVVNGDILTDMDFSKLADHHRQQGVKLTVATCRREVTNDYGVLEVGSTGLVTGFREKPSFSFTVSAGVYVFSRDVLAYVPRGERFGFDQLMHTLIDRGEAVATYPFEGYWLDVGRIDDYEQANRDIERIRELLE